MPKCFKTFNKAVLRWNFRLILKVIGLAQTLLLKQKQNLSLEPNMRRSIISTRGGKWATIIRIQLSSRSHPILRHYKISMSWESTITQCLQLKFSKPWVNKTRTSSFWTRFTSCRNPTRRNRLRNRWWVISWGAFMEIFRLKWCRCP